MYKHRVQSYNNYALNLDDFTFENEKWLVTFLLCLNERTIYFSKRNQHRNDSKCVQRDGSYEDLRRGQDNLGSNDQYMELRTTAQLQTALNPEYQNLSDYDDVVVPHAPNNRNIIQ